MNPLSRRELVLIGLALTAGTIRPRLAHAEPVSFKVPISGGQEVPPVFPAGAGIADLTYDRSTRVLTWTVAYRSLSGPATMAHFHGPAQPGKNAPVLIWLIKQGLPLDSPINGQATLTPDQARQFEAGEWYINIHTQAHPEGEIRGQVLTPSPARADDSQRTRRSRGSKH
jgi:CHRD domain-containing protein